MIRELALGMIETSIQCRFRIDPGTVEEYAQAMKDGAIFPPLDVFSPKGSERFILAEGHHRYYAAEKAKLKDFRCKMHVGDEAEALHFALSANAEHGLRRTSADKRKAVLMMLNSPAYDGFSLRDLADVCKVSHNTVRNIKLEINEKAKGIAKKEKTAKTGTSKKAKKLKRKTPPTQAETELMEFREALNMIAVLPYELPEGPWVQDLKAADRKQVQLVHDKLGKLLA